jgi:hypothetical protein
MWTLIDEGLKVRFHQNTTIEAKIPEISAKVKQELISPSAAAEALLSYL